MSQGQWIKVIEKYPECEYGMYLCYCEYCEQEWISVFQYQDKEFFETRVKDNKQEEIICMNHFVTHWMELPEPPTNSQQEDGLTENQKSILDWYEKAFPNKQPNN